MSFQRKIKQSQNFSTELPASAIASLPQDQLPALLLHINLRGHTVNQIRNIIWLKNNPDLFGQQLPKHPTQAVNVRCYINISVKYLATALEKPKE